MELGCLLKMSYPKFEEALKKKVVKPALARKEQPGYGIVVGYDPEFNTATVLTAKHGTDVPGEMFFNVPCPVTPGIQGVAPEIGRPCWLAFRNPESPTPIIVSFFSMNYQEKDYLPQNEAVNPLPRFMTEM